MSYENGTCSESVGVWPCRPGLDTRKCMQCQEYPQRLENELSLRKREQMFQEESKLLVKKIQKKLGSKPERIVIGGYTFLAESAEAAKFLREKLDNERSYGPDTIRL